MGEGFEGGRNLARGPRDKARHVPTLITGESMKRATVLLSALIPAFSPLQAAEPPPDLLDLLILAAQRVEVANEEGNPILSAWLTDANAAIAKATTN